MVIVGGGLGDGWEGCGSVGLGVWGGGVLFKGGSFICVIVEEHLQDYLPQN